MSPWSEGRCEPVGDGRPTSSPEVAIVFASHCPNLGLTRRRVRAALVSLDLPLRWKEWNTESPDTPSFARNYASPTVLVDGRDVGGEDGAPGADSCRIYPADQGSAERAPSVEAIARALAAGDEKRGRGNDGGGNR